VYNLTKFNKNRYLRSLSTFEVSRWRCGQKWHCGSSVAHFAHVSTILASFCGLKLQTAGEACAKQRHYRKLGGR